MVQPQPITVTVRLVLSLSEGGPPLLSCFKANILIFAPSAQEGDSNKTYPTYTLKLCWIVASVGMLNRLDLIFYFFFNFVRDGTHSVNVLKISFNIGFSLGGYNFNPEKVNEFKKAALFGSLLICNESIVIFF